DDPLVGYAKGQLGEVVGPEQARVGRRGDVDAQPPEPVRDGVRDVLIEVEADRPGHPVPPVGLATSMARPSPSVPRRVDPRPQSRPRSRPGGTSSRPGPRTPG